MNPNNFNQRTFNHSISQNPSCGYFYPFPINTFNPMNYQFLNMQPLQTFPFQQFNTTQTFFGNFCTPQTLFFRNSPSIFSSRPDQVSSNCIIIDDEPNRTFEKKLQLDEQYAAIKLHRKSTSITTEKEEYSETAKIEEKIEEELKWKSEGSLVEDGRSSDGSMSNFKEKLESCDDTITHLSETGSYSIILPKDYKGNQKLQLREMIMFIIRHHGRIREDDLLKVRANYQSDPTLLKIFEALYSKYSATFKTRAEIVKYITRKAFSTIKNNSKRKVDSSSKEACEELCKRYFQASSEEIQSSGVDLEKRERFLQLLFPYQKNSKNKVQDLELISKLMSSKEFYEDYCLYVKNLDSILEADNNRKLPKFINHILSCVKKNQLENILKFKRVPWLKTWIENTKSLAKELAFSIQWKSQQTPSKQHKKEKNSLSHS